MTLKPNSLLLASALLQLALPAQPAMAADTQYPAETIGDWTVTFYPTGMSLAVVTNSAQMALGTLCGKDSCTSFVNPQITCVDGNSYPGLVNAPSAAFTVTMKCEKIKDFYVYDVPLAGGLAEAMAVGGVIGFAFPMASGEFKVARFSLTGAARASARAQQYAQPPQNGGKAPTSDNYSL